ncbi:MAG: ABC transporter substrate-binding protein [Pseudonocardiaceae bacterium]
MTTMPPCSIVPLLPSTTLRRGTPICVAQPAIRAVTRRNLLKGATALGLGSALAGCGTSSDRTAALDPAGDIRTIEHKYGSTRISGMPERVVTVGLTEQDYVLALGITPIGAREWFGEYPGAIWPWAQDELGDGPLPAVLPMSELNFEQIVALNPDVVLGLNSGLTQQEYDTLSQIAPTIAQPSEYADYGAPWQKITEAVGRALGRDEQANSLIPGIEQRFDQVRAASPQFEGKSALLAAIVDGGAFYIYAEGPGPAVPHLARIRVAARSGRAVHRRGSRPRADQP